MNKLFKFLVFPAVILGMAACSDLEENLVGDITNDIQVEGVTDGGAGDVLNGAYSELRNAGTANHGSYYSLQEITSDEMVIGAKGGDWFDGGILIQLHQHTYTPTHDFVNNAWTSSYNAINTVNEQIVNTNLDANQVAQMRALRAYFYLRLLDLYGNVPLVTEPGGDAAQVDKSAIYAFVESELLDVLGIDAVSMNMDLSGSDLSTEINAYRINQYGALGILAKLYLNAEVYIGTPRYAEAAMAAGYVIDSGAYALCGEGCAVTNLGKRPAVDSDPEMLEGYAAVFAPNNQGNPEHIFTVEYDEVSAGGMNFGQMNLHYASQLTYNMDQQPWNGYATLEEFYNSYDDNDARKQASFLVGEQLDFAGKPLLDYAADDESIVLNYTPSINQLAPNYQREAGARPAKFSLKQLARADMDNDYPIVRLGQLYLIRAEGMARANGNWDMALDDVNVLRRRAGVAEYTSLDADEFLAERGREMFAEGVRRSDLIRFGKYNGTWWEKPVSPEHVNIFPIPTAQLQANPDLEQNPGY